MLEDQSAVEGIGVGRLWRRRRRQIPVESRPMIWLTGVEGLARLLSFGFYVIAARALAPAGFGVVQYTITLAMLAFGVLQVLMIAVSRELGAERADRERTREVLGSGLLAALVIWAITTALCLVLKSAGLGEGASTLGFVVVLSGTAVFQFYYAIARGLGERRRQAASYVGASFVQLLMFLLLVSVTDPTPTLALVIFGASSVLPVAFYEAVAPVLRGRPLPATREIRRRLWAIGVPLLAAQVGYLLWNSLDQLWVHGAMGSRNIGLYASAKNLSQALVIIPFGVTGALLPRVAHLVGERDERAARHVVRLGAIGATAAAAVAAALMIALRTPLLTVLFGEQYGAAAGALALLSVGMVFYTLFAVLTMAAVGWGRPGVYTTGIAAAAAAELVGFLLFGCHSLAAAAGIYAAAIGIALACVVLLVTVRPLWQTQS